LARAIIDLTHSLNLVVVAEGIERAEQRDELRRLHCNYGQGYFFGRPLDVDAVDLLMSAGFRVGHAGPSPARELTAVMTGG
jgi:EAL domain-containing protein (putative c-di-GMP-specific phosphodiesterase class I)